MGGLMVTLRKQGKAGWICLLLTAFLLGLTPGTLQASPALSGNVPMGSYVYEYIDKLEGMGLLSANAVCAPLQPVAGGWLGSGNGTGTGKTAAAFRIGQGDAAGFAPRIEAGARQSVGRQRSAVNLVEDGATGAAMDLWSDVV